jgi:hypothetical protein
MTTPISVDNVVPPELSLAPNQTSAKAVLNDRWLELPPQVQETFSPDANNTMRFRFGSNLEYVNFPESYLTFDLTTTLSQPPDEETFLDGGLHALFRQIRLLTTNGDIELEDYRDANRMSSVRQKLLPDHAGSRLNGFAEGIHSAPDAYSSVSTSEPTMILRGKYSSVAGQFVVFGYAGTVQRNVNSSGVIGFSSRLASDVNYEDDLKAQGAEQLTTYVGAPILPKICVWRIDGHLYQSRTVNYIAKAGDTAAQLIVKFRGDIGLIDGGFYSLEPVMRGTSASSGSVQQYLSNDGTSVITSVKYVYRPDLELWKQTFPLLFIQGGLTLEFILDSISRVWAVGDFLPSEDAERITAYTITNPRLHLRYITVHPSIRKTLRAEFDSNTGIEMGFLYRYLFTQTRNSTIDHDNIEYFPGYRSVRGCILQIQDSSLSEGTGLPSKIAPSLSMGLASNIYELYVSVGSLNFPITPITVDAKGHEVFHHLRLFCKRLFMKDMEETLNITEHEWYADHIYDVATNSDNLRDIARDSLYRYYAFDLSRSASPYGFLTGVDTTSMPIVIHIRRTESPADSGFIGAVRARLHVYFDRILTLSARSGIATTQ